MSRKRKDTGTRYIPPAHPVVRVSSGRSVRLERELDTSVVSPMGHAHYRQGVTLADLRAFIAAIAERTSDPNAPIFCGQWGMSWDDREDVTR